MYSKNEYEYRKIELEEEYNTRTNCSNGIRLLVLLYLLINVLMKFL